MLTHRSESRREGPGSSPRACPGRSVLPRSLCPLRICCEASPITCRPRLPPEFSPPLRSPQKLQPPLWHQRTVGAQAQPLAGFPFHPRLLNRGRVASPHLFPDCIWQMTSIDLGRELGRRGRGLMGQLRDFHHSPRGLGGAGGALPGPLTPGLAHRSCWSSAHRQESHTRPQGSAQPSPPGSRRQGRPLVWAR